jgi:hypothetical protein
MRAMNISLYKANPFSGLQTRKTRPQRRFAISIHRFIKKCIDLINNYETIQINYKQLFSKDTLPVTSEAVYRERFTRILQMNRELMDAYGKEMDQFINRFLDIRNISKADKAHFEYIVDVYLMIQNEYLVIEKLFKLPFLLEELSSDNTSVVNIPAESIKKYTGKR